MNSFKDKSLNNPRINYSRSKNIINVPLNKFQDLTRYNSANFNVYLYQKSPNRDQTPIKSPNPVSHSRGFLKPQKTDKETMLFNMSENYFNLDQDFKKKLIEKGVSTHLRVGTCLPTITQHRSKKHPYVLNDFHIRETNPGFARNALGGFFTH